MRERFDAGSGLVAVGAVALLVSLFLDWYTPGGDAWAVFEWIDLALAGVAIYALLVLAPRFAPAGRALPLVAAVALAVVAVQLFSKPPAARGSDLDTGAWLALAATACMAAGAALAAASISVTIDVQGRERRRRAAAIDAREGTGPAAEDDDATAAAEPGSASRRFGRREGSLFGSPEAEPAPGAAEPPADPQRTQALDPVDPPEDR
jgi:hypothetical protein